MKSIKLALGLAMLGVPAIQAATIAWSSQAYTVGGLAGSNPDLGIIATTGTQILAENSGGAGTTFDGITFSAPTINFFFGGNAGVFYDSGTPLFNYATYSTDGQSKNVSFTGLTVGQMYRVQVLLIDGRAGANGAYVLMDGNNMGVYANGVSGVTWGNGLLVTGNFTADVTGTQSFNVKGYYAGGGDSTQMNAILLHAIPEPGAALLGGIGMLALLRRRR